MNREQVKRLLKRIKSNYANFVIDDFKITEWHNELKNYDENDVHKKLEEHMRSEDYGRNEPKLYFLTKYLKKINDKNNIDNYYVKCKTCNKTIRLIDYDNHFSRCNSIDYISLKYNQYFHKNINREKLFSLTQEEFDKKYDELLKYIYTNTKDENEKKVISKILFNTELDLKDIKIYG